MVATADSITCCPWCQSRALLTSPHWGCYCGWNGLLHGYEPAPLDAEMVARGIARMHFASTNVGPDNVKRIVTPDQLIHFIQEQERTINRYARRIASMVDHST